MAVGSSIIIFFFPANAVAKRGLYDRIARYCFVLTGGQTCGGEWGVKRKGGKTGKAAGRHVRRVGGGSGASPGPGVVTHKQ